MICNNNRFLYLNNITEKIVSIVILTKDSSFRDEAKTVSVFSPNKEKTLVLINVLTQPLGKCNNTPLLRTFPTGSRSAPVVM